jgi:hypothetical protein
MVIIYGIWQTGNELPTGTRCALAESNNQKHKQGTFRKEHLVSTPLDLIRMGGPAMLVLIQLFLLCIPVALLFALFSFIAKPNQKRVRAFARIALFVGILFVLIGALGFASGASKLKSALATVEIADPARIQAIGMKEARVPLWTGLVFGSVAVAACGLFYVRGSQLQALQSEAL